MSRENIQVFCRPLECTEWLSNSSEHDLNNLEMILKIKPNIDITTKQKNIVKRMSMFFGREFFKIVGTLSFNWIYPRTKSFHIIYFGYYGQLWYRGECSQILFCYLIDWFISLRYFTCDLVAGFFVVAVFSLYFNKYNAIPKISNRATIKGGNNTWKSAMSIFFFV